MMPRWLALIGTVVLVIVAIILFSRSDNPTLSLPASPGPQVKGAEAQEVLIVYANGVFTPSKVKISAGQPVVFQNASDTPMQIASNPYPYDNDLPGLNSKQVTAGGGTYSYVFPRAGTFGFHNELNPAEGGTVVAAESQ